VNTATEENIHKKKQQQQQQVNFRRTTTVNLAAQNTEKAK